MTDKRLRLSAAQLRPLVPIAALALVALAAWLAWTGWQQLRDRQRDAALQQVRDVVAQAEKAGKISAAMDKIATM